MVPYLLLIEDVQTSLRGDPYYRYAVKLGSKKCNSRENVVGSKSYLISNATGRKHYMRQNITCSTPNVAYMGYLQKARC